MNFDLASMITANVLQRVFLLEYNDKYGSCFTVDIAGKQYVVTAKHVVEGISKNDSIRLFHGDEWKHVQTKSIGVGAGEIDIAVFCINERIYAHSVEPSMDGILYGQDVYFLGFPYGWYEVGEHELNRGFPLPFVKKAIVSNLGNHPEGRILYLDGHNNKGFSGGPVVFKRQSTNEFRFAGVVSSYRWQPEEVYISDAPSEAYVQYNTGIIEAFDIEHAVDIIKSNPAGTPLN